MRGVRLRASTEAHSMLVKSFTNTTTSAVLGGLKKIVGSILYTGIRSSYTIDIGG